jgi:hypothetical protein
MLDSTDTTAFKSGETVTDTAYSKDGAGAWSTLAITDTFAEISSTGVYEIDLTASEMNHDQVLIKCTSTNSADSMVLFNMGNIANQVWDRVLTAATHDVATSAGRRIRQLEQAAVYAEGSVWVDEAGGSSTGTTDYEDATVDNRADDFDNAQTVANSLGIDRIHVQNGDSITLSATLNGYTVWGGVWTLALGGQDIGNCAFLNAMVSGIGTGTTPRFNNCTIGTSTLPPGRLELCSLTGTVTVGSAGNYQFVSCQSGVAGASAPTVDLGGAVGATTMEFRRWSGGLTLNNVQAGDVVSVDVVSGGTITVNGTGGTVVIRGLCDVTDGSSGSVSITQTSVLNTDKVPSTIREGTCQAGSTSTTIVLDANASSIDDTYKLNLVTTTGGTGVGQSRQITAYAQSSQTCTVSSAWTTTPDNTTTFEITARGLDTFDTSTDTVTLAAATHTGAVIPTVSTVTDGAKAAVCSEARLAELDAANLPTDIDAILADTGTDGVVLANDAITAAKIAADAIGASELATDAVTEIANGILDLANGVETGYTVRQVLRVLGGAAGGKASGMDTTSAVIRNLGDTLNRISATVDADGNRSAVTLNLG